MILMDLGGTLFYRTSDKDVGRQCDYKLKRYQYFFRPGHEDFLLSLLENPRAVVVFYSSMMKKNITPVMHEMLDAEKLRKYKERIGVFDRECCRLMKDVKEYEPLVEDPWDTFKDLRLVF